MIILRLGLADQAAENASQSYGFIHGAAGRGRSQSLEVEGQVVLDGSTRLHSLNLEGRADISQRRRSERQGLGMVLLPSLVLGAEVESARVLKVGWEHNGLVAGFSGKLNAEVPGVEGHKDEIEVLGVKMLGGECIKAVDSVPESTGISHMLPCQGRQTRCGR